MALNTRFLVTLCVYRFFWFSTTKTNGDVSESQIQVVCANFRAKEVSGKQLLKLVLNKFRRKMFRFSGPNTGPNMEMKLNHSLRFLLQFSGNIELNPGLDPVKKQNDEETTINARTMMDMFKSLKTGQESIVVTQNKMLDRLSKIEVELESVKTEVVELGKQQLALRDELDLVRDEVSENSKRGKDLSFKVESLDQYTPKNWMRIFNICEENRENVEEKVIEAV